MKIQISKESLLKGIQVVYPIIPLRSTLPILSHILLEASKDQLHIAGTDLELGISSFIETQVQEDGAIALPAKRFYDLVKELPDTVLTLTTKKNNQVSIECEKGLFKIMGLPKEEFPRIPHIENQEAITMDQGVFQSMIGLTNFAISHDESRYVLTGALLILKGGAVRLVSTDGRRLAMIEKQALAAPRSEHQVIIPLKTVSELYRLLGTGPSIKIAFKENQVAFDFGNIRLISRLIDGKFPNYEQVIPKECPHKLVTERESFLLAARRISLWTTPESPSIRFDLKQNLLVLSKQTPEIGEAHEELQATYSGPEFSVGFNPSYMVDVLKALSDGKIEIEFPGPDKPGVIRTRDRYIYIVLPMQLSS